MVHGFWSYVHADDQAEGGRICQLARDLAEEFKLQTAEALELFLDKDEIGWGHRWRALIDENLASVAFFIPVLTPRYFLSPECRRELQLFIRKATSAGVEEIVLPLLYIDFPALHASPSQDDLIDKVLSFQYKDWTDLRFCEPESEMYRRGVASLVTRLVEANRRAEERDTSEALEAEADDQPYDDAPGLLDRLAKAEEALPKWNQTVLKISERLQQIGQIIKDTTTAIHRGDSCGKGYAARLVSVRKAADRLAEPVEDVWALGNEFATLLHDVDEGFRLIIAQAPAEAEGNLKATKDVRKFFGNVRHLSGAADSALESTQKMVNSISPIESISRDLRPILRRLRRGLTTMIEARGITSEWVRLMDQSGLPCVSSDCDA